MTLYFKRASDGAWLGTTVGNPAMSIDVHRREVGDGYGFAVEVVESDSDPRTGRIIASSLTPPTTRPLSQDEVEKLRELIAER